MKITLFLLVLIFNSVALQASEKDINYYLASLNDLHAEFSHDIHEKINYQRFTEKAFGEIYIKHDEHIIISYHYPFKLFISINRDTLRFYDIEMEDDNYYDSSNEIAFLKTLATSPLDPRLDYITKNNDITTLNILSTSEDSFVREISFIFKDNKLKNILFISDHQEDKLLDILKIY